MGERALKAKEAMVQLETMASSVDTEPHKRLPQGLPTTLELSGGIVILARVSPSEEKDFAQILLPVALSYETFLCKICVALGVQKERIKKVLKLPDILIRTTEDVVRLENWEKLELRLKRQSPIRTVCQKIWEADTRWWVLGGLLGLGLGLILLLRGVSADVASLTNSQTAVNSRLDDFERAVLKMAQRLKELRLSVVETGTKCARSQ